MQRPILDAVHPHLGVENHIVAATLPHTLPETRCLLLLSRQSCRACCSCRSWKGCNAGYSTAHRSAAVWLDVSLTVQPVRRFRTGGEALQPVAIGAAAAAVRYIIAIQSISSNSTEVTQLLLSWKLSCCSYCCRCTGCCCDKDRPQFREDEHSSCCKIAQQL